MLKQKFVAVAAIVAALMLFISVNGFAYGHYGKKHANFRVRVENISSADGLAAQDGSKYPFALSPGVFVVSGKNVDLFVDGQKASAELEAQAEDGNPDLFAKMYPSIADTLMSGVFNKPVGSDMASPILPGGVFEFTFTATQGMKLNIAMMYGQSNDLFYAPAKALKLFVNGKALSGDITEEFLLWDAGTEVNQAPGLGADQGPRQKMANTGADENGVVRLVKDGFTYPVTKDVLRITITAN